MPKNLFQIGEIAKLAGVNIQTLRYYERRNILTPNSKKASGFRLYAKDAVQTVRFIKHAQELGFKLEEIKQLLSLRAPSSSRCQSVRKKAAVKLSDVQEKITLLKKMEKTVKKLISDCEKNKTSTSCPIIDSMEESHE